MSAIDLQYKVRDLLRTNLTDPNTARKSGDTLGAIEGVANTGGEFKITLSDYGIPDGETLEMVAGGDLPAGAVGLFVAVRVDADNFTLRDSTYASGWSSGGSVKSVTQWVYEDDPRIDVRFWPRIWVENTLQGAQNIGMQAAYDIDVKHMLKIHIIIPVGHEIDSIKPLPVIDTQNNAIIDLMKNNIDYFQTYGYFQPRPLAPWSLVTKPLKGQGHARHIRTLLYEIRERT